MLEHFFSLPFKLEFLNNAIFLFIIAALIIITCFKLIISNNLIESLIVSSAFSLLIGLCYLLLDAPDVAMTETALGVCISTCVMLNMIKIFGEESLKSSRNNVFYATILCLTFLGVLTWASLDLPEFGMIDSPLQSHLSSYYIQNTQNDIGIPSFVAAILASYRGFDTLGETSVILIAGLAVLLILSQKYKSETKDA